MAKIDLRFLSKHFNQNYIKIEERNSNKNENYIDLIEIKIVSDDCGRVFLDKSTAIKFAKTLRTEIAKIK
mgnify:CR=1 FL=1|tara:strand:+ start:600 stop:809 length:210 start_codon:yes stop_codon:yes gene_type:complete